jgi:hypothetical protein
VQTLRPVSWIFLTCAVAIAAAACSSSTTTSGTLPSVPTAPATSGGGGATGTAATEQQIAANWVAFFNPKTPISKRVDLLQDGSQFQAIIAAQANSTLESEASAAVTKVALTSASQAKVTYTILLAGAPALPDESGISVLSGGVWQVGVSSFCGLLTLENGGSAKGLPSICLTAG